VSRLDDHPAWNRPTTTDGVRQSVRMEVACSGIQHIRDAFDSRTWRTCRIVLPMMTFVKRLSQNLAIVAARPTLIRRRAGGTIPLIRPALLGATKRSLFRARTGVEFAAGAFGPAYAITTRLLGRTAPRPAAGRTFR